MSNLSPLNYAQFKDLFSTNEIYFLDFYADWCGPCRMMSPVLESFANDPDFAGITFAKVDVDAEQEFSQAFEVRSIPAFFLVKFNGNGFEKIGNWIGGQDSLTFGPKILKLTKENSQNSTQNQNKDSELGSNSREI